MYTILIIVVVIILQINLGQALPLVKN